MGPQRLTRPCLGDHVVLELISRSVAIMLRILCPGLPFHFYCFFIWMRRMFHFLLSFFKKEEAETPPSTESLPRLFVSSQVLDIWLEKFVQAPLSSLLRLKCRASRDEGLSLVPPPALSGSLTPSNFLLREVSLLGLQHFKN